MELSINWDLLPSIPTPGTCLGPKEGTVRINLRNCLECPICSGNLSAENNTNRIGLPSLQELLASVTGAEDLAIATLF